MDYTVLPSPAENEKTNRKEHEQNCPMYSTRYPAAGASSRYSGKNNLRPVNFVCFAPDAKRVTVLGDFNEWNPAAHPMHRRPDGAWFVQVNMTHGHHQYLFCIDGKMEIDPRAQGIARNSRNERVSVVAVS